MRVPFADLKRLHEPLREEIDAAIGEVLSQNSYITGPAVSAFEEAFAKFCGVGHAVGVASGTDALVLALKALGLGPGDEVITVPNTFIATSEAITAVGAEVRFVDVDPQTYVIDLHELDKAVTPRTRAVIPVHLYGQQADMEGVRAIANKHSLFVIEDAAQAHGASWKGQPVGALGDCACFSFYPGKNLGAAGDAGAVITRNGDLAAQVKALRNHGREPGSKYEHAREGFNARMDSVQAAFLNVKLPHLEAWNRSRQRVARLYQDALSGVEGIVLPRVAPEAEHVFHLYVIQTEGRDEFRAHLQKRGISTGIHYPIPLHLQPAYSHLGLGEGSFPVAESLASRIVSLPMFACMGESEVGYVADNVKESQSAAVKVS